MPGTQRRVHAQCRPEHRGGRPQGGQVSGAVTELRPGMYAFNDAQQVILGSCTLDQVALSVLATVVSTPAPDRFVLDAGAKVLGYESPAWTPGQGLLPAFPEATVTGLWEHHAVAATGPGPREAVGDRIVVIPKNHVCTTVNLVDELHVVRDGQVTERWPVDARGRGTARPGAVEQLDSLTGKCRQWLARVSPWSPSRSWSTASSS